MVGVEPRDRYKRTGASGSCGDPGGPGKQGPPGYGPWVERLSELVHKAYCAEYERQKGEPYWTHGDYSLLDEDTKKYDRVTVQTILNAIGKHSENG